MAKLTWDETGKRYYETGVDHGVLYPMVEGAYGTGVAWSGLTGVTESPSGAEASKIYADNIVYVTLRSAEEYGMTIEAFTWPDEWTECDGLSSPVKGVTFGQQKRKGFGFSWRTIKGNDVDTDSAGYKLHLVYNSTASPSEKAYATKNDSPEAITFSWECSSTPVPTTVTDKSGNVLDPVASITIDSTTIDPAKLAALEKILYGDGDTEAKLPLPDEVYSTLNATA